MAGGIFPGRPFEFNLKCIVFSLMMSLGYWYAPHKNLWVLGFLIWFPYILLAWYDWSYNCENKLQPTAVPFGRYIWLPFKPAGYKQAFNELPPDKIAVMDKVDHITGWTLVAALATWYLLKKRV